MIGSLPCWPSGKVKCVLLERLDLGAIPACAADLFFKSSHTNDLKIGTPVGSALELADLLSVGRPTVSIM